jgi:hypothetical protein
VPLTKRVFEKHCFSENFFQHNPASVNSTKLTALDLKMMPGTSFGGANAPPTQNVSPFPQPPEFALNYTTDNIKNQRTLKPPPGKYFK